MTPIVPPRVFKKAERGSLKENERSLQRKAFASFRWLLVDMLCSSVRAACSLCAFTGDWRLIPLWVCAPGSSH